MSWERHTRRSKNKADVITSLLSHPSAIPKLLAEQKEQDKKAAKAVAVARKPAVLAAVAQSQESKESKDKRKSTTATTETSSAARTGGAGGAGKADVSKKQAKASAEKSKHGSSHKRHHHSHHHHHKHHRDSEEDQKDDDEEEEEEEKKEKGSKKGGDKSKGQKRRGSPPRRKKSRRSQSESDDSAESSSDSDSDESKGSGKRKCAAQEKSGFMALTNLLPKDMRMDVVDQRSWNFEYIEENLYLYRRHKPLPPKDEAPVCECPLIDGEPGCTGQCLNRRTNVECYMEYCPCGIRCANQRFQRKLYVPSVPFRTERKGWGLACLVDVLQGQFVIEYVGEVISKEESEKRRQRDTQPYPDGAHRHLYLMVLSSTEVVDATKRGNCARFINHSCQPNCMTVKWEVRGEPRVGIFAKQFIPAGTELSFDYQLVRDQGDANAKQECHCGAPNCRRFVGAAPSPSLPASGSSVASDRE